MELKNIFIGIYQAVVVMIMFIWTAGFIVALTFWFQAYYPNPPTIIKLGWILGSLNLLLLSLTKNWSLFPYIKKGATEVQER